MKLPIAVFGDVNSDVHSHFMTQIEGEFSPLNYGVSIFPVHFENGTGFIGMC